MTAARRLAIATDGFRGGTGSGSSETIIISNPSTLTASNTGSTLSGSQQPIRLTSDSGEGSAILGGSGSTAAGDNQGSTLSGGC